VKTRGTWNEALYLSISAAFLQDSGTNFVLPLKVITRYESKLKCSPERNYVLQIFLCFRLMKSSFSLSGRSLLELDVP